ncbi:MAG: hypothetical protein AAF517_28125 [Planctomycetota bacterium]
MAARTDPTEALCAMAAEFPEVDSGTSCNQSAFKTKKVAFLYVGPGAKGEGFKAMFKLDGSRDQAAKLAKEQPDRFALGVGQWVTVRFTAEKPLPKSIWSKWLKESYELSCGGTKKKTAKKAATKKKTAKKKAAKSTTVKKAAKKKAAKKKAAKKKTAKKRV